MRTLIWVIVALVVIALVVALAALMARRRREDELRRRFGPEYDRAVDRTGDRRKAQAQLEDVARRREQLDITDLSASQRARFDEAWLTVQTRFVDEPGQAVTDADGLVTAVMRARGYPVEDFEERAWLLATDHADVVDHYRQARAAHHRHLQAGRADTEDLRQAFVHYRLLYGVLSGRPIGSGPGSGTSTLAGAHAAESREIFVEGPENRSAESGGARSDLGGDRGSVVQDQDQGSATQDQGSATQDRGSITQDREAVAQDRAAADRAVDDRSAAQERATEADERAAVADRAATRRAEAVQDREAAAADREAAAQKQDSAAEREASAGSASAAAGGDEGIVWDESRAPAGESTRRRDRG